MSVKINDLLKVIYEIAPLSWQESYDNCGLIVGDGEQVVESILLCIDVTEDVIDEAIKKECSLIISHHPLIFKGIKQLVPKSFVERTVIKAVKNDIAIAAIHTNLDNSFFGVNKRIADLLGLKDLQVLQPQNNTLKKLVVFCPEAHAENIREAIFSAGAGEIGKYDCCSFNLRGEGSFRAGEGANPFVGDLGRLHHEAEQRIEFVLPAHLTQKVVRSMIDAHPYEEVAYDIYPIENDNPNIGAGMMGILQEELSEKAFFDLVMEVFKIPFLKHSPLLNKKIKKVAVCGGSGSFLISQAKKMKADVFLTGDIKYHDFFEADKSLLLVDSGHFETEQFTKDLIGDIIRKKFPNFAVQISEVNTNAVGYYFKSKL